MSTGKVAKLCKTNLYGISMSNSLRQTVGMLMWNRKYCGLIEGVVRSICIIEIVAIYCGASAQELFS